MNHFAEQLRNSGFEVTELQHAYRINGVIDILKKNHCKIYDNVEKKWVEFADVAEKQKQCLLLLENYPKQDAFKKTAKGNISYQQFKNSLKNLLCI